MPLAMAVPTGTQVLRAHTMAPGRPTSEQLLLQPLCCLLFPSPSDSLQPPFLEPGEESTMPFRFPKSHLTGLRRRRSPLPRKVPHSTGWQAAAKSPVW